MHDLNYKYQYDSNELLEQDPFWCDTDWEIVGNIYNIVKDALPNWC